ncbi:odorant receptor [Trichonephila clavipes]|nr:odorant receptor [Trichonephila clavipes]
MDYHLENHDNSYSCRCITDRSVFNGVINVKTGRTNGETSFAQNDSKFCLQHQDGRIRVSKHRGERTLAARIRHRHTGLLPDVTVWVCYWMHVYTYDGTLKSARYTSDVLRPMVLPLIEL